MDPIQKPLKKRYKYRIYPNQTQQESLNKLFGCCRYVFNRLLAELHGKVCKNTVQANVIMTTKHGLLV